MTTSPDFAEALDLARLGAAPFQTVTATDLFATSRDFATAIHSIAAFGDHANSSFLPVASPLVFDELEEHIELVMSELETGFKTLAGLDAGMAALSPNECVGAMDVASGLIASDSVRLAILIVLKKLTAEHNAHNAANFTTSPIVPNDPA